MNPLISMCEGYKREVILNPAPEVRSEVIADFCDKPHDSLLIQDCSMTQTQAGFSSGTFKDYRSAQLVRDFRKRHPVLYSIVYTTAGYSLGHIAKESNQLNSVNDKNGIKVVSVIDEGLDERIKRVLAECSTLVEVPLTRKVYSREEIRAIVVKSVGETGREYIDAENYGPSYSRLAQEAFMLLSSPPDYIFMPLGGGEAVNSFLNYLEKHCDDLATPPRIIAATIGANVYSGRKQDTSIADKLVTPCAELFEKVSRGLEKNGQIVVVEEEEIMPAYTTLQQAGIKAEPSAAVAFAAAKKLKVPKDKTLLIVNSGSGIHFDENGNLRGGPWK